MPKGLRHPLTVKHPIVNLFLASHMQESVCRERPLARPKKASYIEANLIAGVNRPRRQADGRFQAVQYQVHACRILTHELLKRCVLFIKNINLNNTESSGTYRPSKGGPNLARRVHEDQ